MAIKVTAMAVEAVGAVAPDWGDEGAAVLLVLELVGVDVAPPVVGTIGELELLQSRTLLRGSGSGRLSNGHSSTNTSGWEVTFSGAIDGSNAPGNGGRLSVQLR